MAYLAARLLPVLLACCLSIATQPLFAREDGAKPRERFEVVRENPSVNGERRQVVRYMADGLMQYALVLWPTGEMPADGWPVLLFNHGYHPDPPQYGRDAQGRNDRPGDYYRGVAQAFVDRGLVVVAPDFRGHNDSEGVTYTRREDAPLFYARDAVAAFRALDSLPDLDASRRYMLGHSMGGLVTLAALGDLGVDVAAASIWSSMALPENSPELAGIDVPLLVQHAAGDATTAASGSQIIAEQWRARGGRVELYLYACDDHLFTGEHFEQAIARDLQWFERRSP